MLQADGWAIVRSRGLARPGAFGHGRRLLRLVPIEDARRATERLTDPDGNGWVLQQSPGDD